MTGSISHFLTTLQQAGEETADPFTNARAVPIYQKKS